MNKEREKEINGMVKEMLDKIDKLMKYEEPTQEDERYINHSLRGAGGLNKAIDTDTGLLDYIDDAAMSAKVDSEGIHKDDGKLRMDLIPPEAERALAEILTYGASKYPTDRNWEYGIQYSRIYGSLRRHLLAWLSGETLDPESLLPHLNHALCNIVFLVTYEERDRGRKWDDLTPRWSNGKKRGGRE